MRTYDEIKIEIYTYLVGGSDLDWDDNFSDDIRGFEYTGILIIIIIISCTITGHFLFIRNDNKHFVYYLHREVGLLWRLSTGSGSQG